MPASRLRSAALALLGAALILPSAAQATDEEIRTAVTEAAPKIASAERAALRASKAFDRNPGARTLRRFRKAARDEEALLREIRADLRALDNDTADVGEGRDLMASGLLKCASGLDRIDKALGRAARGEERAARRSIRRAQADVKRGNELIERGEPLVGAELTP